MPRLILKPERDVDFYVEWSTIVDSVTASGTRAELTAHLGAGLITDAARFERADETGTSATGDWAGYLGYDDSGLVASAPLPEQRWLPRANLRAFAEALADDDVEAAFAVTDPIGA